MSSPILMPSSIPRSLRPGAQLGPSLPLFSSSPLSADLGAFLLCAKNACPVAVGRRILLHWSSSSGDILPFHVQNAFFFLQRKISLFHTENIFWMKNQLFLYGVRVNLPCINRLLPGRCGSGNLLNLNMATLT